MNSLRCWFGLPRLLAAVLALGLWSPAVFAAKVRVGREDGELVQAVSRAATGPILDYGAFRVVKVDAATAAALAGRPGVEVLRDANRIFLNAGTIDTASAAVRARRATVRPFAGRRLHLVQFAGPIQPEWTKGLEADGLRLVNYLPENAYLVWGDATALARFQSRAGFPAAAVEWEGQYRAEDKLDPSVWADAKQSALPLALRPTAGNLFDLQLVADEEANAATLEALARLGGKVFDTPAAVAGFVNYRIELPGSALAELAAQPDVVSIHRHAQMRKMDEAKNFIVAGALTFSGGNFIPTSGNWLTQLANWGFTQAQFDASGFVVDVTDDGVDTNPVGFGTNVNSGPVAPRHFVLYRNGNVTQASRFVYKGRWGSASTGDGGLGVRGHGQFNMSLLGGFVPNTSVTVGGNTTTTTAFPHADSRGFRYGMGVAPFVRLANSVVFDPNFTNPNFTNMLSAGYASGARISSNSWTAETLSTYTVDAQTYDSLVRDAQPGTAGTQQMIIVFSAGNFGPGVRTVRAPGTAKNVITVGASENVRSNAAAAGGNAGNTTGADGCDINDTEANNADDMARFSGTGPTSDGRFKPDLVAPGTHITGMTFVAPGSTLNGAADTAYRADGVCAMPGGNLFFPVTQRWWTTSSGTSHAAAAVSGAAALIYQQFINNPAYLAGARTPAGSAPPSPALTKAYLINTARHLTGARANDTLPSNSQGMGAVNLGRAFDGAARAIRDQVPADRFTASGQQRIFAGTVENALRGLRVTLVWSDAPGATSGNAYVNNLDLTVSRGGLTYRGNVFSGPGSVTGGSADARNNVESVYLPMGFTSDFIVTVTAANIAGQADPAVPGHNQDFALVVENANSFGPSVNAMLQRASAPSVSGGNGNDRLDPNECVSIDVPLINVGGAAATGITAVLTSSTPGVTVTTGSASYADLASGGSGTNLTPFRVSLANSITCPTTVFFTLTVSYGGGLTSPEVINFPLLLGPPNFGNYVFTPGAGATIPAGGTLVAGSNVDDGVVTVNAPFNFSIYGTTIASGTTLTLSSNGSMQFVATGGMSEFGNSALPAANLPAAISLLPFWDDLDLRAAGFGIYTQTIGSIPNRQWIIEWRGALYNSTVASPQNIRFAVVLSENSSTFQYRYIQTGDGSATTEGINGGLATVGVQSNNAGPNFTQYSFNSPVITPGLVLTATLQACTPGSTPACGVAPVITSAVVNTVLPRNVPASFSHTATGTPTPTFTVSSGAVPSGMTLSPAGVVAGVPTVPGISTYTITASNGTLPNAVQTGQSVEILNAYQWWRRLNFSPADLGNPAISGDNVSPAGDGLSNVMKYAYGLSNPRVAQLTPVGVDRDGSGRARISFPRNLNGADLTLVVEARNDLATGSWTPIATWNAVPDYLGTWTINVAGTTVTSGTPSGVLVPTTVTDSVVLTGGQQRFLRVRAVVNP